MPCRVWVASDFPHVAPPARSQCYDHGLYSRTHLFVVEVNLSRAIFYRRLAFPELRARRLRQVVLNYHIVLPKPARLIAAIIFIELVASAIHFLTTKPFSGALTKTYSNPAWRWRCDGAHRRRSEQQSLFQRHFGRRPSLQPRTLRHQNKTTLQRRPVMRPVTAM